MTAAEAAVAIAIALIIGAIFISKKCKRDVGAFYTGKNVLITGGSSGLGLAIAKIILAEKSDAPKQIVLAARNIARLEKAHKDHLGSDPRVKLVSCDVTDLTSVKSLFDALDGTVDILFSCAGASIPGFFLEQNPNELAEGMQLNYLGSVYAAQEAAKRMKKDQIQGRIVFIASTLAVIGLTGYSQYAPTKWALRGLAECLRQELAPHGITTHLYLAGTIATEGFDAENRTKPEITRKLEGTNVQQGSECSPESRAQTLLKGTHFFFRFRYPK